MIAYRGFGHRLLCKENVAVAIAPPFGLLPLDFNTRRACLAVRTTVRRMIAAGTLVMMLKGFKVDHPKAPPYVMYLRRRVSLMRMAITGNFQRNDPAGFSTATLTPRNVASPIR